MLNDPRIWGTHLKRREVVMLKENWFQNYTKDFHSESGYNGSHGINGNVNSHETVRDFLSSDG